VVGRHAADLFADRPFMVSFTNAEIVASVLFGAALHRK
jgi:hypothetical protein